MFQVKPMRPQELSFAVKLANTMNWNMAPEDFAFAVQLEPGGCFVLFEDSKPMGIATCISYGKIGWFGNLIVKEEIRHEGAGSMLVERAIDYLRGKGAQTIGLYAYPNLLEFYGKLGFKADEELAVFHASALNFSSAETLPKIGKQLFPRVAKFDGECFGGDRTKLLESIVLVDGNLGFYESKGKEVVGYIAATVYETMAWVGPLMCQQGEVDSAASLLEAVLAKLSGKSVYAAAPKKETALTWTLSAAGFKEDFSVVRMFYGPNPAKNCIYLAESLERG
jgi:predicted N-acetyltransferase YhbS